MASIGVESLRSTARRGKGHWKVPRLLEAPEPNLNLQRSDKALIELPNFGRTEACTTLPPVFLPVQRRREEWLRTEAVCPTPLNCLGAGGDWGEETFICVR
jgi:hypothetical protein